MKLLLDQGTPSSAAELFRLDGFDTIHTSEIGMARAADIDILIRAKQEARIVVTLDRDFPQLLALSRGDSPSVIQGRRQGLTAIDFHELISNFLREFGTGLKQGGIVSVGRNRRFRQLPLR